MNTKSEGGWTMMALIFTVVLVVITLSGSLWVMYHLNTNMMPRPSSRCGRCREVSAGRAASGPGRVGGGADRARAHQG